MGYMRRRLGELLVGAGAISRDQLDQALGLQLRNGGRLGTILVEQRMLSEERLADVLAQQKGLERVDLATCPIDRDVVALLPERVARRRLIIPIGREDGAVVVAMADPLDLGAIDEIELRSGLKARVVVSTERDLRSAIEKYMSSNGAIQDALEAVSGPGSEEPARDAGHAIAAGPDAPMVRLVNQLIRDAISGRASDIHIEPGATEVVVRFRVDGVLHEATRLPRSASAEIASRIKIMADMNITERRRPQEGCIRTVVDGRGVDFRVTSLPAVHGESIVIRVLNQGLTPLELENLGLREDHLVQVRSLLARPYGAILFAGPTGSGKSMTQYAALRILNETSRKLITVEDPIQYQLAGVTQISVNPKLGLSMASGLRHAMRSDPDVVMVSELRDPETAEIAMHGALTGHLVLSSIHTSDAPSALSRLADMKVAPFVTSSAVLAVIGQRIVRRLCPECRQVVDVPSEAWVGLGVDPEEAARTTVYGPGGCESCLNTGYRGRVGLFEVMVMDDDLRKAFLREAPADQLRALAVEHGMRTLRQDAMEKVASGLTSIEEVVRVVI